MDGIDDADRARSTNGGVDNEESSNRFELKKEIGLWSGVAILSGCIVGSGIFINPTGVLAGTNGSVGISLLLWIACGVLSAMASMCYAELGTSIMESGGTYTYINAIYGDVFGFMYSVVYIFVLRTATGGLTAIAFGTYVAAPFYPGDCQPPEAAVKCTGSAAIIVTAFVNYMSVKATARIQIVFTIAKFLAMAVIIVGGLTRLAQGDPVGLENFRTAFSQEELEGLSATQIELAFYQGLYSYTGWNFLNLISEEVKDVGKTLPRCIIMSLSSVTAFYLLVNIAYLSVLSPAEMIASQAVASTFGDRVLGTFSWFMPLSVCLSVFGSLNGSTLVTGRPPFVAARRGHLPQIFAMVSVNHRTPGPTLVLCTILSLLLMIPSSFNAVLNALSFTSWTFFGLCAAGVLVMKKKRPDLPRPYKVPTAIPVIVVICSVYLVIAPVVERPDISYLYALICILCTPILYYPFVYKKYTLPGVDRVTTFLQQLLEVAPTDWKKI